jgi:uncharacterized protein (TIGR02246 family)
MIAAAIALLLAAAPAPAEDVRAGIEAANRKWEAALSKGDAAALGALYTADGELLPAHSDAVRGPKSIANYLQAVLNAGIRKATLTTLEVDECSNTASEVGTYEFKGEDGTLMDHGKYIVLWKKEGGAWKLHRDMFTTSVMPAKE